MNRIELSELIYAKLIDKKLQLREMYQSSQEKIGFFFIDDLLPYEIAKSIYIQFPNKDDMELKRSIREYKYIAAQMNNYNPILEEAIFAFQDEKIVSLIGEICEINSLHPDEHLYAGGISMMGAKQFLNPHLDNSHDKDRRMWRVLNLLYYVTPGWEEEYGGNLELWPNGLRNDKQIQIHSKFNRLVVMATHNNSWHSVSPISEIVESVRCCVSNYYFSESPIRKSDLFHITSFRGRPDQKVKDFVLRLDAKIRMQIRKVFRKGIIDTKHRYEK